MRSPDRCRDSVRSPGGVDVSNRAVTPAVAKTLELGIVVLFVGLVTTALLGGVVPAYRTGTGAELGDRVLVTASQEIERAVPPAAENATVRRTVDLPASIAGSGYDLRVDGRWLVLDHPDREIRDRVRLTMPRRVERVEGRWQSGADATVSVRSGRNGLIVELRNGGGG